MVPEEHAWRHRYNLKDVTVTSSDPCAQSGVLKKDGEKKKPRELLSYQSHNLPEIDIYTYAYTYIHIHMSYISKKPNQIIGDQTIANAYMNTHRHTYTYTDRYLYTEEGQPQWISYSESGRNMWVNMP